MNRWFLLSLTLHPFVRQIIKIEYFYLRVFYIVKLCENLTNILQTRFLSVAVNSVKYPLGRAAVIDLMNKWIFLYLAK